MYKTFHNQKRTKWKTADGKELSSRDACPSRWGTRVKSFRNVFGNLYKTDHMSVSDPKISLPAVQQKGNHRFTKDFRKFSVAFFLAAQS